MAESYSPNTKRPDLTGRGVLVVPAQWGSWRGAYATPYSWKAYSATNVPL
jgi:hypothetical protein